MCYKYIEQCSFVRFERQKIIVGGCQMDKLNRLKYLLCCGGLSTFIVLVVTLYGLAVYSSLTDVFSSLTPLLDPANWKFLAFI